MNRATYNITNDRLKVWFAERLPREEYDRAKSIGFVYWFGSKCLTCTWRPGAEDFIRAHRIEIEEDDQPDDTEGRADRFQKYADKAETHANGAQSYLEERANTARRRENASNAVQRELSKAEYWNRRIEAAIRHASFKERPDVIARRIEGLETDLRHYTASFTPHEIKPGVLFRQDGQVIVGPKGRGARAVKETDLPELRAWGTRWVEHIEDRLLYERAALAVSGGAQADLASPGGESVLEVGGAVKILNRCFADADQWLEIVRVNPKSLDVFNPLRSAERWPGQYKRIERSDITEIASKTRVDADEIPLAARAPKVGKVAKLKVEIAGASGPEKMGGYGLVGYSAKPEDQPTEWSLITKVNRTTIERLTISEVTILSSDSRNGKSVKQFGFYKERITRQARFLPASEMAKRHPELLEAYARATELRTKRDAARSEHQKRELARMESEQAAADTQSQTEASA